MSRDTTGPRDPPAPPNARYRTGRGKPTRNMRCNACGRRGHVARECRQLAMYIWLTKYMGTMSDNDRLAVLDHWDTEQQSRSEPDRPRRSQPRTDTMKIGETYIRSLTIGVDEAAEEMDWEFVGSDPTETSVIRIMMATDTDAGPGRE